MLKARSQAQKRVFRSEGADFLEMEPKPDPFSVEPSREMQGEWSEIDPRHVPATEYI